MKTSSFSRTSTLHRLMKISPLAKFRTFHGFWIFAKVSAGKKSDGQRSTLRKCRRSRLSPFFNRWPLTVRKNFFCQHLSKNCAFLGGAVRTPSPPIHSSNPSYRCFIPRSTDTWKRLLFLELPHSTDSWIFPLWRNFDLLAVTALFHAPQTDENVFFFSNFFLS